MNRAWRNAVVLGLMLLASSLHAQAPEPASEMAGTEFWATTALGRLKARVYPASQPGIHPVLIVVLHGDAPFSTPTYQYRFAQLAAAVNNGVVVAAVLRPGYFDGESRSDGTRGRTTGDNYTPEVVDAVDQAIGQLREKYQPGRIVLVGHSGGAAISADLLGRHPETADAALLVSCPCDVAAWRRHMKARQGSEIWDAPVTSLSPMDLVPSVSPSARVWMVVGAEDHIAPPALTNEYAAALRAHGVKVDVVILPGLAHDILLEGATFDALHGLLAQLAATASGQPRPTVDQEGSAQGPATH